MQNFLPTITATVTLILCLATPSYAQNAEDFASKIVACTSIQSDKDRLHCYDQNSQINTNSSENTKIEEHGKEMRIKDYILDKNSLLGQTVGLWGVIYCLSQDICIIAEFAGSEISTQFDFSLLSREDRSHLIGCGTYSFNGCSGSLSGEVKNTPFGIRIQAKHIGWMPRD